MAPSDSVGSLMLADHSRRLDGIREEVSRLADKIAYEVSSGAQSIQDANKTQAPAIFDLQVNLDDGSVAACR